MDVLVINSGSSSLKVAQTAGWPSTTPDRVRFRSELVAQPLGAVGPCRLRGYINGRTVDIQLMSRGLDHVGALAAAVDLLDRAGQRLSVRAVAHRVVHGGRLREPHVFDANVRAIVEAAAAFAPLHNPVTLSLLSAAETLLPAPVRHVACFDSAFFAGLPPVASRLPVGLGPEWSELVRRHGFHGFAHQWMSLRVAGLDATARRVVTVQLGSGSSTAALRDGRPVDTSMGLTPLDGLVMRTRSGSVDPGLILHIVRCGGPRTMSRNCSSDDPGWLGCRAAAAMSQSS